MTGTPIRQDYLETAIKWINDGDIEDTWPAPARARTPTSCGSTSRSVIAWVKATFPNYRKEMKGVEWGELYNQFKDAELDSAKLEEQVASSDGRRRRHEEEGHLPLRARRARRST